MAHLYFTEQLTAVTAGDTVELRGAEARHAVAVGRAKPGEQLMIGDGAGTVVDGEVLTADRELLSLRVGSVRHEPESSPRLILVQALAKGDRDELAIQAATELGVDAVVAWAAHRSVSRWEGPKVAKGLARWQAIVREASKQSLRARVPGVSGPVDLAGLSALAGTMRLIVLDPMGDTRLADVAPDGRDLAVVVGPEGGISPAELDALTRSGATRCLLGSTILRTSTAGPASIAVLNTALGRW